MIESQDAGSVRELAVDIARGAGQILLGARAEGVLSKSSPTDIVTDADRESERYIVDRVANERPDDSLISEEGSLIEGTSGVVWVVDPLDATVNYFYGIPHWCVSIGIEGAMRAGVVYDVRRGEIFTDVDTLHPSKQTNLEDALVGTGFSYSRKVRERQAEVARRVIPRVRDVRRAGSCALDLAWVACGRLDAFYEEDTHHWDISAGIALIEAAGGVVHTEGSLTMAAGTQQLLDGLYKLIST